MYLLRITSLIFALGLMVAKLFASPVASVQSNWDDSSIRTYQINPFTKIYLEGTFKVILDQGSQEGLKIKADEDNFKYIEVQSEPGTNSLKISKKHFDFDELVLYITFKNIEDLVVEGGISLETKGYVDLKNFNLHVEGGACVVMNLKADNLTVVSEGGVQLEFNGIANELNATISGAGHLNAIDLKAKRVDIKIEGVGAGSVYATDILYATISGLGKIRYKGDPQVFKKIEGIGLVSGD